MNKHFGIIYKATNKVNGCGYIGQTTYPMKKRKKEHKSQSKTRCMLFHQAIRDFGFDNFTWEILYKNVPYKDLNKTEEEMIVLHHTHYTEGGYNRLKKCLGNRGYYHSEETKLKMCNAKKGKTWDEIRGIEGAERNKKELSKKMLGKNNHRYGKHPSDETIKKWREKVRKYTDSQIEKVREYRKNGLTFEKISDIMNINTGTMNDWCKDIKIKHLSKKYSNEIVEKVKNYRRTGMSFKEISKIMNINDIRNMRHWCKDIKISQYTNKQQIDSIQYRKKGIMFKDISKIMKIPQTTIQWWWKRRKYNV